MASRYLSNGLNTKMSSTLDKVLLWFNLTTSSGLLNKRKLIYLLLSGLTFSCTVMTRHSSVVFRARRLTPL